MKAAPKRPNKVLESLEGFVNFVIYKVIQGEVDKFNSFVEECNKNLNFWATLGFTAVFYEIAATVLNDMGTLEFYDKKHSGLNIEDLMKAIAVSYEHQLPLIMANRIESMFLFLDAVADARDKFQKAKMEVFRSRVSLFVAFAAVFAVLSYLSSPTPIVFLPVLGLTAFFLIGAVAFPLFAIRRQHASLLTLWKQYEKDFDQDPLFRKIIQEQRSRA